MMAGEMQLILNKFEEIQRQMSEDRRESADSRRRMYERQDVISRDVASIGNRVDGLEKSVEGIRPTTAELERVRDRVMFAGKLGQVMWGIGKALLSAAAGAAAAWYAITGRPPP